ncbi:putative DD34D transposase [Trichonephila clavipes]|nr:putative DD34D transposase [Trichonephila clavipes]
MFDPCSFANPTPLAHADTSRDRGTGDEKWVTYYNIVQKLSWSKCGEAAQTVAKPGLTARKVLLYLVGLERNNLLGVASAWPELAYRRGVFHQDNARPQTSVVTCQNLGAWWGNFNASTI